MVVVFMGLRFVLWGLGLATFGAALYALVDGDLLPALAWLVASGACALLEAGAAWLTDAAAERDRTG